MTFLSHAPGSLTKPGGVSCQTPGSGGPTGNGSATNRPSSVRAAITAHAAASPVAIPPVLAGPSATAALAASNAGSTIATSAFCWASVPTTPPSTSTRWAAAATARSWENERLARTRPRYGS